MNVRTLVAKSPGACSGRSFNREADRNRHVGHALVVADNRSQIDANHPCRCEMDGIKRPQHRAGSQRGRVIKKVASELDLVHSGKLPSSVRDRCRPATGNSSHDLDSGQRARHSFVVSITTQESPQRLGLGLTLDKLYQR